MSPRGPLVIGIGHRLRGDDALGLEVLEALRIRLADRPGPAPRLRCLPGDATGLLAAWEGEDCVLVIDALAAPEAASGQSPVWRIDARAGALPALYERASSHGLGLAEAVELGRSLERLPARLVVFAVRGESFGRREGLSAAAQAAIRPAVAALEHELAALAKAAA
ncbi:MAG: hydrogenase maturation protease [Gammaproteobacteria bacterium]|nr:hydrogenase maturation protease [Gammaproteobacteria bacterium]TVQ48576.1 MAG: hydrogenase maturation protease [Gammaproteobacteria bacterium]